MSKAPLSVARPVIHHAAAQRAVAAAVAKAESLGVSVVAAVVDCNARLVAFLRMPNAFLISNDVVMRKAISVASVGIPAEIVEQALAHEAPRVLEGILAVPGFTIIRGGLPIHDGDAVVGAIGVSGGSEAQDELCAAAGVAAALQGAQ